MSVTRVLVPVLWILCGSCFAATIASSATCAIGSTVGAVPVTGTDASCVLGPAQAAAGAGGLFAADLYAHTAGTTFPPYYESQANLSYDADYILTLEPGTFSGVTFASGEQGQAMPPFETSVNEFGAGSSAVVDFGNCHFTDYAQFGEAAHPLYGCDIPFTFGVPESLHLHIDLNVPSANGYANFYFNQISPFSVVLPDAAPVPWPFFSFTDPVAEAVPEPCTSILVGFGLLGSAFLAKAHRSRSNHDPSPIQS